jgi:hypothetical protein
MTQYNQQSLGKFFLNNGKIFKCIGYCPYPTLTFQNLETGEQQHWAVNSMIIENFEELQPVNNQKETND